MGLGRLERRGEVGEYHDGGVGEKSACGPAGDGLGTVAAVGAPGRGVAKTGLFNERARIAQIRARCQAVNQGA
jgi:hypothetical protein